ncbi:hypothetical protein LINGRAHAP2_LOCUS18378 [Linum grandiflorum]
MKLESKQGQKSDAEAFEHIDNNLGSVGLKPEPKENQNGVLVHDANLREEDYVDQILYQTTNDEAATKDDDDSDDMDDLAGDADVELRRFVEPLPSALDHVVKDICVDEGLPLHDKFLFDTNTDYDVEYLSTFLSPGKAENGGEVVKDSVVQLIVLEPIVPDSSGEEGSENAEIHSEEAHNDEASGNSTGNDATKDTDCSCHAPLSDQTSGLQQDSPEMSKGHENDSKLASLQDSVPPETKEASSNAAIHEEDITSERHSLDSLPDELTARLSFDTKVDNATVNDKIPPNNDPQQELKTVIDTKVDNATVNDKIPPNDDPQQELKTVICSKIGYEPVPHSGSISMGSDSSTTSTRSFAFPVLQNEWNSSPVRMAKPDRKQLRKHRHWKQRILCCKF